MNKKYEKGVRFERKLVNEAKAQGKIAFRSAGSHSQIDVCIIDTNKKEIEFIQAKTGKAKLTKKEEKELMDFSDKYIVKFSLRRGNANKKRKTT